MSKKSLSERIQEVKGVSAPSLVPAGIKPKEPKEYKSEVLPDITQVIALPATRAKIVSLVTQRVNIYNQEKELKKARKALVQKIKEALGSKEIKFMVGDNRVVLHKASHKSISADKLLALGVLPATIKAAIEEKETLQLKVTPPGKEEEDDRED